MRTHGNAETGEHAEHAENFLLQKILGVFCELCALGVDASMPGAAG